MAQTPAHSPLPWKFVDASSNQYVVAANGQDVCGLPGVASRTKDFKFIVRAVNGHAALVEALEWTLTFFDADFEHAELDKARAALALAKGE